MTTVLVTGSQGFLGSYICNELLSFGYDVIGIDDYSKYGPVVRAHDCHPRFKLYVEDVVGIEARDLQRFEAVDFIVAGAAMIGGISYFHRFAYDLLAENERIMASTFDLALHLKNVGRLKRIIVISSSMVYESAVIFPTPEGAELVSPPPISTYGFQKLACEYFCKGAWQQHGLPYTIVRPFNCVGVGEQDAISDSEILSGNVKLMMSHVLPDIVNKCMQGQYPLRILGSGDQVRCYTNGRDIARAFRLIIESDVAMNNAYNISTSRVTTVSELAEIVWNELGDSRSLCFEHDAPFEHDVQHRVPSVSLAREQLGFEAEVDLETSVREVIAWFQGRVTS